MKNPKKLIVLSLLLALISCGGEDLSKSSKVTPVSNQGQSEILTSGELITQYSVKGIVQCALEDIENNPVSPLKYYSTRRQKRVSSKLHVKLTASLTKRITQNLQSKTKNKKLTPSSFWTILDDDLQRDLSKILINSNVNRTEEDYRRLQQEVAFAFTVYIENPTEDHGYRLLTKSQDETVKVTKIGFTQFTQAIRIIKPCADFDISTVYIPEGLRSPRNITAKILCENTDKEKLSISGSLNNRTQEEEVWIHLVSKDLKDNFRLMKRKINTLEDKRKRKTLTYEGNEIYSYKFIVLDITKESPSQKDSIKKLDFVAYANSGDVIKVKKLSCKTLKELKLD